MEKSGLRFTVSGKHKPGGEFEKKIKELENTKTLRELQSKRLREQIALHKYIIRRSCRKDRLRSLVKNIF